MNRHINIIFSVFLFIVGIVKGQDMQFTQFYAAPMYLNPALTGANVCSRVSLNYRSQWPGVSNVYRSKLASFDHCFYRANLGVGLMVGSDEAGNGGLKTTIINPAVSYEARIDRFTALRFGLQPGVGIKSINMNKLVFGDQIYRGGNVTTVETIPQSKTYFDLGAGMVFVKSDYWIGISGYHLNVPNESFFNSPYGELPIKYSVHMGAKFQINKDEKEAQRKKYITPVIHYRGQKKFGQLDLGFYLNQSMFSVGFWYRGIPFLKTYKSGYQNNDAIAIVAGIQLERIKIGYSYDQTISRLAGVTKGAHEITLSFQACNPKQRKRRLVLVSCPKF
jgi:type IX secretion system PorP/SprF family membrane protein